MSIALFEEVVAGRAPGVEPLTVDQFHKMIETGILREGEPVELIDGCLVRKDQSTGGTAMAHSPRHAVAVSRIARLDRLFESVSYHVRNQLPVTLAAVQEPEPDGAVVRGTVDDFAHHHPAPPDIRLIIEAADSSLEFDRSTKQRIHAAAAIESYWIVNLVEDHVEAYETPVPSEGRYERRVDYKRGQTIAVRVAGSVIEVQVIALLP